MAAPDPNTTPRTTPGALRGAAATPARAEPAARARRDHPTHHDDARPDQTAAPHDTLCRLVGLSKSFGKLVVLDGVSLNFARGQTTVVLGPSGTGKSVLLKHIVGLLRPDRGEVWFDNQRIDTLSEPKLVEVRKQIGFLFQMGALFDSMNVADNICFPLNEHTRMSRSEKDDRCRSVLNMVGLNGVEKKMPAELSGGQRKRVALARAVVMHPKLVLYDEPTTGLDPITADLINELIITLADNLGVTSIAVTHDIGSARKVADRMVMLAGGRIIADGPRDAFLETDDAVVQRFIQGRANEEELDAIRRGFAKASP